MAHAVEDDLHDRTLIAAATTRLVEPGRRQTGDRPLPVRPFEAGAKGGRWGELARDEGAALVDFLRGLGRHLQQFVLRRDGAGQADGGEGGQSLTRGCGALGTFDGFRCFANRIGEKRRRRQRDEQR